MELCFEDKAADISKVADAEVAKTPQSYDPFLQGGTQRSTCCKECSSKSLTSTPANMEDLHVHQWDTVSNLVETLIPIEEKTLEVSHNYSSASCIIPFLTVLQMLLQDDERPSTQGIRTLRPVMRESLIKHFSKLEETKTVAPACLLDLNYTYHTFSCINQGQRMIERGCGRCYTGRSRRGSQ